MPDEQKKIKIRIAGVGFILFLIFVVGLFWLATTPERTVGLTLSFVAGLSMIFLPCTLPLAFVIVPMTLGKDPQKGFLMAVCFGLGLTITLSFYGVFIAALGKTFGLKSDVEVYAVLFGGLAAFIFGLSEIGLLKFKLPSYSGKFPDFIQRQKDYVKTFLLGLLLGNAGVGCPNPAFYLLLGYIATTADLFNGWFLGFVHGLGRAVPLIFLAILGTLGVNALSGVTRHKETVERSMGWMLVIIGAYLLTFGLFGHDWFIASGIHSAWEQLVNSIGGEQFGEVILKHEHKLIDVPNFIQYGNIFFLAFLAVTMFVGFAVTRPSRRAISVLVVIYALIALLIGYSTGWTFKMGTTIHIQFRGLSTSPSAQMNGHHAALYHEETDVRQGLAVNLNMTPVPVFTGVPTRFDFFVNQKPGNIPVTDLEIEHTKLMHVIGVRNDMEEFFHIHPNQRQPGLFSIDHQFVRTGLYKIWSEVKRNGVNHTFGHQEFVVQGARDAYKKEVFFGRSVIVGNYQVLFNYDEPLIKNHPSALHFDIHDVVRREIEVEPYLGADMHLAVIKDDFKQFIHTHPVDNGIGEDHHARIIPTARAHGVEDKNVVDAEDKEIEFNVVFPEAGIYRVFAQFRPKGIVLPADNALAAAFWVQVEEKAPPAFSAASPLMLTGISLFLILILSWLVKRYITVTV